MEKSNSKSFLLLCLLSDISAFYKENTGHWEFKRKRQAELLSAQPISLEYLRKIIFRCNTDYKRACNIFDDSDLYIVDRNMFNNERNYMIDYDVDMVNYGNIRSLLLNFNTNLQVFNQIGHRFELYDMNNNQLQSIRINYPETPGTEFKLRIDNIPSSPIQFKFWFYNILSIEEIT